MCACTARHRASQVLGGGDDRLLAAVTQKAQSRFDFRAHTSRREMSSRQVAFQIGGANLAERALRRLLVIEVNVIRVGGDDKQVYSRSEEHTSELQSLRHLVCR